MCAESDVTKTETKPQLTINKALKNCMHFT